jgi:hypothetical protein
MNKPLTPSDLIAVPSLYLPVIVCENGIPALKFISPNACVLEKIRLVAANAVKIIFSLHLLGLSASLKTGRVLPKTLTCLKIKPLI